LRIEDWGLGIGVMKIVTDINGILGSFKTRIVSKSKFVIVWQHDRDSPRTKKEQLAHNIKIIPDFNKKIGGQIQYSRIYLGHTLSSANNGEGE